MRVWAHSRPCRILCNRLIFITSTFNPPPPKKNLSANRIIRQVITYLYIVSVTSVVSVTDLRLPWNDHLRNGQWSCLKLSVAQIFPEDDVTAGRNTVILRALKIPEVVNFSSSSAYACSLYSKIKCSAPDHRNYKPTQCFYSDFKSERVGELWVNWVSSSSNRQYQMCHVFCKIQLFKVHAWKTGLPYKQFCTDTNRGHCMHKILIFWFELFWVANRGFYAPSFSINFTARNRIKAEIVPCSWLHVTCFAYQPSVCRTCSTNINNIYAYI